MTTSWRDVVLDAPPDEVWHALGDVLQAIVTTLHRHG